MKKLLLVLTLVTATFQAQEVKQVPQISVSGEGKIKVSPDEAMITVAVENTGKEAAEVKKKNDEIVDRVVKLIKQRGIPTADYQTQSVNLYKNYDYNTKKYNYVASQTISIYLKDLSKYDKLMMDLLDSGINSIQGVEFKSSKIKEYETQARKKAMINAKQKAEDYVSVLSGQKVGKAILISETELINAIPLSYMKSVDVAYEQMPEKETLAIGEIEVICNVSVSYVLE
ncbi:MAG: SIMPL domain-containing protein [Flavobacterium sp.]